MKQQTYTAGKDLILHDGEIYLIDDERVLITLNSDKRITANWSEWIRVNKEPNLITHSTATLDGVIKIDRQKFVKPVDVEALAENSSLMVSSNGRGKVADLRFHFRMGFRIGHNANKGVYTLEQLKEGLIMAFESGATDEYSMTDIIAKLTPLTLPSSVTLTDNEITEIVW